VRRALQQIAPILHLTRVTSAFAAVANVWLVILWTRANEWEAGTPEIDRGPLSLLLVGGAVAALGLYGFGACLNDILDVKRDRTLRPDRPLASGRVGMELAVSLVAGTLIAAILGATVFGKGAVFLTLFVAAAVLVYNAAGKFIPAVGMVMLGLIFAGHMAVPNINLTFIWPVWLVMTHALVVAGLTHAVARKVPPVSRRAVIAAALGWVFWSGVIFWIGYGNRGGEGPLLWPPGARPAAAVLPGLLILVFIGFVWRKLLLYGTGYRSAEKIARYGSIWPALYGCGWLLGQRAFTEAMILGALAAAGLVGMTVLREAYGLAEQPLGYRR
jgi:hypothetical protein